MSIKALNWALNRPEINETATAFVLLVVANYADESGFSYPSQTNIAVKTRLSVRTVQRHLIILESLGLIAREMRRSTDGRRAADGYQILHQHDTMSPSNQHDAVSPSNGQHDTMSHRKNKNQHDIDDIKRGVQHDIDDISNTTLTTAHIRKNQSKRTKEEKRTKDLNPPRTAGPTEKVFQYWQKKCGHPTAKLSPKRERLITARLKEFPIADLFAAVDGCAASGWHNGENPGGKIWDDIGKNICLDIEHVEMFRDLAKTPPRPRPVNRPVDVPKPAGSDRPCATCDQVRFIDDPDGSDDPLPCPRCSTDSHDFVIRQRRGTIAA